MQTVAKNERIIFPFVDYSWLVPRKLNLTFLLVPYFEEEMSSTSLSISFELLHPNLKSMISKNVKDAKVKLYLNISHVDKSFVGIVSHAAINYVSEVKKHVTLSFQFLYFLERCPLNWQKLGKNEGYVPKGSEFCRALYDQPQKCYTGSWFQLFCCLETN